MTIYSVLAGRIHEALSDLERVVHRAEELLNKAQQHNDDGYLDGVALNLHGFYAGVEPWVSSRSAQCVHPQSTPTTVT